MESFCSCFIGWGSLVGQKQAQVHPSPLSELMAMDRVDPNSSPSEPWTIADPLSKIPRWLLARCCCHMDSKGWGLSENTLGYLAMRMWRVPESPSLGCSLSEEPTIEELWTQVEVEEAGS